MARQTLGSTVRHNVVAVSARLNGSPDTAEEWQAIARQLRAAADAARKIAKIAGAMGRPDLAAIEAANHGDDDSASTGRLAEV